MFPEEHSAADIQASMIGPGLPCISLSRHPAVVDVHKRTNRGS